MLWSPWVFLVGMLRQWPSWWNGAEGNLICKGSCYTATPHGKFKARRRQGDADVRGLLWQKSLATTQSINIVLFHGSLPASLDHTWDPWVDMIASVLQISADTFNIIYLITSRKQPGTPMVVQNVYPPPDLNNNIKMEALGTGTPLGTIGHLMLR